MAKKPVKSTKVKPAIPEVKRSKEWLRRSKASKKGWKTRKKTTLSKEVKKKQKLIGIARELAGKKPNARIGKAKTSGKSVAKLEEMIEALSERLRLAERDLAYAGWVPAVPPERLSEDFTIALEVSRLRHQPYTRKVKERLDNASGGHFGVKVEKLSSRNRLRLAIEANEIAQQYGVEIREVYTLFFSP